MVSLISTHASLAGRDGIIGIDIDAGVDISTHASLAGRDPLHRRRFRCRQRFQPTRPLRDATRYFPEMLISSTISTHASLAGRDAFGAEDKSDSDISTHASLAGRDARRDS